jgi:hypothetical protein
LVCANWRTEGFRHFIIREKLEKPAHVSITYDICHNFYPFSPTSAVWEGKGGQKSNGPDEK